jgi:hypothetical protein
MPAHATATRSCFFDTQAVSHSVRQVRGSHCAELVIGFILGTADQSKAQEMLQAIMARGALRKMLSDQRRPGVELEFTEADAAASLVLKPGVIMMAGSSSFLKAPVMWVPATPLDVRLTNERKRKEMITFSPLVFASLPDMHTGLSRHGLGNNNSKFKGLLYFLGTGTNSSERAAYTPAYAYVCTRHIWYSEMHVCDLVCLTKLCTRPRAPGF